MWSSNKDQWASFSNPGFDGQRCVSLTTITPSRTDEVPCFSNFNFSGGQTDQKRMSWTNQKPNQNNVSDANRNFREISPRPFESAFRSAIEKMRHTSETRLELLASQGDVRPKDPRMTISQVYPTATDTSSEHGWSTTGGYKSSQHTPRQDQGSGYHHRRHRSALSLEHDNREDFQVPGIRVTPSGPTTPSSVRDTSYRDSGFPTFPVSGSPRRFASDQALDSSINFWSSRTTSHRGSHPEQRNQGQSSVTTNHTQPGQRVTSTGPTITIPVRHNRGPDVARQHSEKPVQVEQVMPVRAAMNYTAPSKPFGQQEKDDNEEDEQLVLPSVREIIQQVEALTAASAPPIPVGGSKWPPNTQGRSHSLTNPVPVFPTPESYLRPAHAQRNLATPQRDNSPKKFVGNNVFTSGSISPQIRQRENSPRKSEALHNMPLDYQKLREAFIDQRKEIQRLRQELAEKEKMMEDLQQDIRLYEPWRR